MIVVGGESGSGLLDDVQVGKSFFCFEWFIFFAPTCYRFNKCSLYDVSHSSDCFACMDVDYFSFYAGS